MQKKKNMVKIIHRDLPEDHPSRKHWTLTSMWSTKPKKSSAPKKTVPLSGNVPGLEKDIAKALHTIGVYHLESGIKV